MSVNLEWYAVYVKSRSEKKVYEELSDKNIEAYIPLQKKLRQWSDRKKWVEMPVINGYVFVRIERRQYDEVLKVDNVVTYVRFEGKAAVIRDSQIDLMKRVLNQHEHDVMLACEDLQPGEKVEITAGALLGFQGELIQFNGSKRVTLRLSEINFNLMIAVPLCDLKRIAE